MDNLNQEEDGRVRRQSAMQSRQKKAQYNIVRMVLSIENKVHMQRLARMRQEKELLYAEYKSVKQEIERIQQLIRLLTQRQQQLTPAKGEGSSDVSTESEN